MRLSRPTLECWGALLLCLGAAACGGRPWAAALSPASAASDAPSCPIDAQSLLHPTVPAGARQVVVAVKKKAWERALGGEAAARPYIRARLEALPDRMLIDRASLPASDAAFARRLAGDTWRGLRATIDRENGLPVDNLRFVSMPGGGTELRVGDYTSGTTIGLYLMSVAAAWELHLLPEAEAMERVRRVLDTLDRLERYDGFLFNFYDTTSLERTSNFVSFIDTAWLTAGLMVVRTTFGALASRCTALIADTHFAFFYDAAAGQVSQGYYVSPGARSPFEYGMLYTEARLGSLIAIGKGDLPERHWFAMRRTFPAACRWQTQTPLGVHPRVVRGHRFEGGYFEWQGVRYVPSWGGSMFEALMPTLVLDEARYAPRSLGANDRAHAVVQRRYPLQVLGYGVWGLSPSATPAGQGYAEYGVRVLGARGYPSGAVAPYASALALAVTPGAALANLRTLAQRYDIYGEYGFYDAVDPLSGTVAHTYITLDQAMVFVALANYLGDHCIQRRFAADPIIQRVLPVIADEQFFG